MVSFKRFGGYGADFFRSSPGDEHSGIGKLLGRLRGTAAQQQDEKNGDSDLETGLTSIHGLQFSRVRFSKDDLEYQLKPKASYRAPY